MYHRIVKESLSITVIPISWSSTSSLQNAMLMQIRWLDKISRWSWSTTDCEPALNGLVVGSCQMYFITYFDFSSHALISWCWTANQSDLSYHLHPMRSQHAESGLEQFVDTQQIPTLQNTRFLPQKHQLQGQNVCCIYTPPTDRCQYNRVISVI